MLEILQNDDYADDKKGSMAAFRIQCARTPKCKDQHWTQTTFPPSFGDLLSCCSMCDSFDCVWAGLGHDDRVFGVTKASLRKGFNTVQALVFQSKTFQRSFVNHWMNG